MHSRRPYSIEERYFYVSFPRGSAKITCLHELFHFFTHYSVHTSPQKLGPHISYNDAKESLTALLNELFLEILDGDLDRGYPQHQPVRAKIIEGYRMGYSLADIWSGLGR